MKKKRIASQEYFVYGNNFIQQLQKTDVHKFRISLFSQLNTDENEKTNYPTDKQGFMSGSLSLGVAKGILAVFLLKKDKRKKELGNG